MAEEVDKVCIFGDKDARAAAARWLSAAASASSRACTFESNRIV
jgi:hypothetical protein